MNRAQRRAEGYRKPVEDRMANAQGTVATVPRYIKRHFKQGLLASPKTRRERRHRARILRTLA